MTPQEIAERSAAALAGKDAATPWLGARIEAVGPGRATLSLVVQPHHLNGQGTCHGGVISTLADSAFAYACNSFNQLTVAQENTVTYLSPARPGEPLTATCTETARSGRSGIYDVTVTGGDGRTVALLRGLSRSLGTPLFSDGNG